MDMVTRVPILDEVVCISPSTNVPGKDIKPTILPPVMKDNSEFKSRS